MSKSKARGKVTCQPQRITPPTLHLPPPQPNQTKPKSARAEPTAKAVQECLGISAESQDVKSASPSQRPQLPTHMGFPQAEAACEAQPPTTWSTRPQHGGDVAPSPGREDGKEPWSPVGLSRKGRRKVPTRGPNSEDTTCRKRSLKAALPPAREQETTASHFWGKEGDGSKQ